MSTSGKNIRLPCISRSVKYWGIIAARLHAEGWSYGIAEHFTKQAEAFLRSQGAERIIWAFATRNA